ncbi:MAG TPA: CoA transferase [Methylomirabilota bacterium]|nr:CoA transferase [Methylomirabilota bacterium]
MTASGAPSPLAALPGADRGGALSGLVVLELAETFAGELTGGLLADLGATVIKVEPAGGSPMRRRGPGLPGEDSLYFQSENRGKLSVRVEPADLSSAQWRPLLAWADALIEDLGPGRLEAAGLSPETLAQENPRLSVLRISPFGQTGPLAGERGDDRIAQAFSGVQFITGFPDRAPAPVTVPLAEGWTAIQGAGALLMAVFHARRSGHGQVADIGLYQTCLRLQEEIVVRHARSGEVARRLGTESPVVVPANVYRTRDGGWVAVSGAGDQPFARLCEAIEAPDAPEDPRFATSAARLANRAAADALVGDWIGRHDLLEVEARFAAVGVAGTAVRSADEILADEHVKARQALLRLVSTGGQPFVAPGAVPKLTRTPAADPARAPRLGEHTEAVRAAMAAATGSRSSAPGAVAGSIDAARVTPGAHEAGGALAGLRVLDLSQWLAGPAAAAILGDFGADVIMIELPPAGGAADTWARTSPGTIVTNRNKRSLALDVRSPRGRELFLDLVRVCDVVVENFRPGTLERWKLGPDVLREANPRLVLLRSSGFGQTGPYTGRAAFNPVGLAFGGITYLNGWPDRPPIRDGAMSGDYTTALFNVLGTMAALLRRDADGQGQVVDTAMFEAALRLTGDLLPARTALGIRRERAGGDWPLYPASVTVEAADGRFVAVSAASLPEIAQALQRLGQTGGDSGAPGDPSGAAREGLVRLVAGLPAGEAVARLRAAGLGATVVNSVADLVNEPHCWSRGDLLRLTHPALGEVVTQGVVPILSRTPGRVAYWSTGPGSDTEAVLRDLLGFTPEQVREHLGASAGGATSGAAGRVG